MSKGNYFGSFVGSGDRREMKWSLEMNGGETHQNRIVMNTKVCSSLTGYTLEKNSEVDFVTADRRRERQLVVPI